MFDVVVVGAGLSGVACALALREAGLSVAVAQAGWGQTANFAGQLQLGASPALVHHMPLAPGEHVRAAAAARAEAPWAAQVGDILAQAPLHPFAGLGVQATRTALDAALGRLRPALAACGLLAPKADAAAAAAAAAPSAATPSPAAGLTLQAWPSASGALAPVYAAAPPFAPAPAPFVALDFVHAGVPLGARAVAGWAYDAQRLGRPLAPGNVLTVAEALLVHAGAPIDGALALARALDDEAFCRQLGQALAPALADVRAKRGHVVVPAVLGLARHLQVRAALQQSWGVPVIEALADAPSVPGVRLMQALAQACAAAHVPVLDAVVRADRHHAAAAAAETPRLHLADGQQLTPRACVLATGRFLGGGLVWHEGGRCREALFDLPAVTDGGPITERSAMELTRRRPEDDQPLLRAGVATDASFRPYDVDGARPAGLWAIGTLLGGYAPLATACRDGVALVTAEVAAADVLASLRGAGPAKET